MLRLDLEHGLWDIGVAQGAIGVAGFFGSKKDLVCGACGGIVMLLVMLLGQVVLGIKHVCVGVVQLGST